MPLEFGSITTGHDPVAKPAGYTQGEVECVDALRSALSPEEFAGACKAQAIQYIWREDHKGGAEDIRKAIWWLRTLVGDDPRRDREPPMAADVEFLEPGGGLPQ